MGEYLALSIFTQQGFYPNCINCHRSFEAHIGNECPPPALVTNAEGFIIEHDRRGIYIRHTRNRVTGNYQPQFSLNKPRRQAKTWQEEDEARKMFAELQKILPDCRLIKRDKKGFYRDASR